MAQAEDWVDIGSAQELAQVPLQHGKVGDIPVATLRNWEQSRFVMEPAAQTLLKLIDREPEAALRALRGPRAA